MFERAHSTAKDHLRRLHRVARRSGRVEITQGVD